MKLSSTALLFASAVCLLAQAPAPKPAPAFTPAVSPDKVIITVGDLTLTAAQFNQLIEMLPEQNRASARGPGRKQFADEIVRVLVLADEGKHRKLDETSAYKTQAQFQAENLLAGKTLGEMSKVDDAELHKYYDAHKTDFEQVRARHILIRAKGSPMPGDPAKKELTDEEALAKAQEIRKKIVDGADFAKLATEESDDSSKSAGGDLNFFKRGQLVPPFEQAAFAMKVGDVSEPVKTPFGYHIIKVEDKREQSFDEAKTDIQRKLQPERSKTVVEDLVKKTSVKLDPEFFAPPAGAPAPPQIK
jgi:peptidyl-prolyl cis-trans isomerase C